MTNKSTTVPAILSFLVVGFCGYLGITKPDIASGCLGTALGVLNLWSKSPNEE